jgi:hypothetical protein
MVSPPDRSDARDGIGHGVRHGLADAEVACEPKNKNMKDERKSNRSAQATKITNSQARAQLPSSICVASYVPSLTCGVRFCPVFMRKTFSLLRSL